MKDTKVKCSQCGRSIDVCYFCEDPQCRHVICRECVSTALGQAKPRTYTVVESP